jgi:hypothetical protein
MFGYIYIIKNSSYGSDIYKLELSVQNPYQIQKKYNKYYIENIEIIDIFIVSDIKLCDEYIISICNENKFIKLPIEILQTKIKDIVNNINNNDKLNNNLLNISNNISKLEKNGLEQSIGKYVLLNDIYQIVGNNLEYLEFIYIIKNIDKYECVYKNNEYYLKNYYLKHLNNNIYEQFINDVVSNDKNDKLFINIDMIINKFKLWYKKNYNYLKLPFKVDIKKNILEYMINIYGEYKYNNKKQIGWNNIKVNHC